ncbi:hypothetical protein K4K58_009250 [Colletotrichum sp. SAR11_239]|nr:hypothetical protein K4K58_009250 [Colletotrichum sp. SAR11_239]
MPSKLSDALQQVNEEPKYVRNSDQEKEFKHAKKLSKARKTYQKLLDEYRGKIVHGSSTLDESYYHFGEDPESTKDKTRRNKSQVVTESWQKDTKLGSYWLLIRVNQLWIWTINNKWLISASSHPIDDGEDELLNGILDRLEKQREAAGSGSQPGSTEEMSQLIIDYCLSSKVKDILDELSMLETIVEYQQDVQKAMKRKYAPRANGKPNILETEYTATYIINDIKRLYSVAERVHAAVGVLLSSRAELAIQQGRVLMVFTVVTTLFLPLSFLTSLFALDVASFQQAPPWALGVISRKRARRRDIEEAESEGTGPAPK